MKFAIGEVDFERKGGIGKWEMVVKLPEGMFWASNRTNHQEGDIVLAYYEPQDQFARILEMDEIKLKA